MESEDGDVGGGNGSDNNDDDDVDADVGGGADFRFAQILVWLNWISHGCSFNGSWINHSHEIRPFCVNYSHDSLVFEIAFIGFPFSSDPIHSRSTAATLLLSFLFEPSNVDGIDDANAKKTFLVLQDASV